MMLKGKVAIVVDLPCALADVVAHAERAALKATLIHTEGRKAQAADILGISRKNLWEKLKAYGLE